MFSGKTETQTLSKQKLSEKRGSKVSDGREW